MTFDRVFLGTDGINAQGDICEADLRQTRLKELMARRAKHVYVLAHAAKLDNHPFHAWAKLPLPWTLVTDTSANGDFVEVLRAQGIQVVMAD